MCVHQGVRNVSFPENIAYVINEWSIISDAQTNITLFNFFNALGKNQKFVSCWLALVSICEFSVMNTCHVANIIHCTTVKLLNGSLCPINFSSHFKIFLSCISLWSWLKHPIVKKIANLLLELGQHTCSFGQTAFFFNSHFLYVYLS